MKFITSIITVFSIIFSTVSGLMPWNAVYYFDSVNGNDANNGKSIEAAFQSLDMLNNHNFIPGTTVYIACGSEFRGQFFCQKGVTYVSYGEGEKPTFLGSANASDSSKWSKTEYQNLWVFNDTFDVDVGKDVHFHLSIITARAECSRIY